jgi:pyruvate dehydrogenase E2 component (dihydrolipoamide acetyltransferase)
MPAVRALAQQLNVDLTLVKASGLHGQITVDDVKKAVQKPSWMGHTETLHGVRYAMAKTMMQSHADVVSVTIFDDADITNISSNDLTSCFIMAIIEALKVEPALNAWFDGKTMQRCLHTNINLGLAIDTKEGLFVPVIKNIVDIPIAQIREKINVFKRAAKDRTFSPEELQDATITLSNFGVFSGRYATLTVVPPTVAILGCGKTREAVLPFCGKIDIRRIVPLSLSFDHRAITGGEAARFLAAVICYLEQL